MWTDLQKSILEVLFLFRGPIEDEKPVDGGLGLMKWSATSEEAEVAADVRGRIGPVCTIVRKRAWRSM